MDRQIELLFEQLSARDVTQRRQAIELMSQRDENLKLWTAKLVRAAGNSDDQVRAWAADTLETLGTPHPNDLSELIQELDKGVDSQSADGEVLYWAATLIGRLGPAAFRATDSLIHVVEHSQYLPARERAVWALGRIGPRAKQAAGILRQVATKGPPRLRRLAAEAIESLRGMAA